MSDFGRILVGDPETVKKSYAEFNDIPVDKAYGAAPVLDSIPKQRTIEKPFTLSGRGTFEGKTTTNITFEPTDLEGWWFDRVDKPNELPIRVSIRNVWTTGKIVSNIVMRSGGSHNYVRMVEHIVAMKMAMGIENGINLLIPPGATNKDGSPKKAEIEIAQDTEGDTFKSCV